MWRNDPAVGAVPAVGKGSTDVGRRTQVGEAVTYDGTDPDALIAFLGDESIINVAGALYQKMDTGTLIPVNMPLPSIVVKPPAGNWFTTAGDAFTQEFAIHVNVTKLVAEFSPKIAGSNKSVAKTAADDIRSIYADKPVAKKAAKKVAAKKAAVKKAT